MNDLYGLLAVALLLLALAVVAVGQTLFMKLKPWVKREILRLKILWGLK